MATTWIEEARNSASWVAGAKNSPSWTAELKSSASWLSGAASDRAAYGRFDTTFFDYAVFDDVGLDGPYVKTIWAAETKN